MYSRQHSVIYCLAATRQQFPAVGIAPHMQRCAPTNLSTNKSGWKTNSIMQPTHLPPQSKAIYVCTCVLMFAYATHIVLPTPAASIGVTLVPTTQKSQNYSAALRHLVCQVYCALCNSSGISALVLQKILSYKIL